MKELIPIEEQEEISIKICKVQNSECYIVHTASKNEETNKIVHMIADILDIIKK